MQTTVHPSYPAMRASSLLEKNLRPEQRHGTRTPKLVLTLAFLRELKELPEMVSKNPGAAQRELAVHGVLSRSHSAKFSDRAIESAHRLPTYWTPQEPWSQEFRVRFAVCRFTAARLAKQVIATCWPNAGLARNPHLRAALVLSSMATGAGRHRQRRRHRIRNYAYYISIVSVLPLKKSVV